MMMYDKYTESYYEVIPVKKIKEKIEELDNKINKGKLKRKYEYTAISYSIDTLQQLIKENSEEE